MKIRIVLADDHTIVLEGLRALLSMHPDLEVVETCTDGDEAVEAVERSRPDVLVIDQSMPGCSGVDALGRMNEASLDVRTILLTATLDDRVLMEGMRQGVSGIVLKESAGAELVAAVRTVHAGAQHFPPALVARTLRLLREDASDVDPFDTLTEREKEVVTTLSSGLSNKRIAKTLDISEGTVKLHLHSIFRKLGATNRVQVTLLARERMDRQTPRRTPPNEG